MACSDSSKNDAGREIDFVILKSLDPNKGGAYRLNISDDYYAGHYISNNLFLKLIYPGFLPLNKENRRRFIGVNEGWGRDRIKVFIEFRRDHFHNGIPINDWGAFSLSKADGIKEIRVSSHIFDWSEEDSNLISYFDDGKDNYVIRHSNGRISLIDCVYDRYCEGQTTWNKKLSITYYFDRFWLKDLVNLDLGIVDFINNSEPKFLKSRKQQ